MSTRHRIFLPALLLLLLLSWFWGLPQQKSPPPARPSDKPPQPANKGSADLDELYDQLLSAAPAGTEPLPFKTKARVHLRTGESAVIGFWQVSKNRNGLAVVTPEVQPDGTMKLAAQLLQVSDAVISDKAVRGLFPAPFDVEQSGAMQADEVRAVLEHLRDSKGAVTQAMPTVVTRPGSVAIVTVLQTSPDDAPVIGMEITFQPSEPQADGSFDLNLHLQLN